MNDKPILKQNNDSHGTQEIDFSEQVCSPEFPQGCIDPLEDVPVPASANDVLTPAKPVDQAVSLGEVVCSIDYPDRCVDPQEELENITFENVSPQPEVSFSEVICSPEFPQGCVDPLDGEE